MRTFPAILLGVWLAVALNAGAQVASTTPAASAPGEMGQSLPAEIPLRRDADLNGATPGAYAAWMVVLAIAVAGVFLVRSGRAGKLTWARTTRQSAEGELRVVAVRALSPQTSLQVVEWNGKQLLLGCTSRSITVLDVVDEHPSRPPAAADGATHR